MKNCIKCQKEFIADKSYTKYCSIECCKRYQSEKELKRRKEDKEYREKRNKREAERRRRNRDKKKHAEEEKKRYRKKHGILSDKDLKCAPRGTGTITKYGYRQIPAKNHPNAWRSGMIFEHVLVMSNYLGRALYKHENVHHRNGIRHDNRIENLELWSRSQPYGQRIEDKIKWCIEFLSSYGYEIKNKPTIGQESSYATEN